MSEFVIVIQNSYTVLETVLKNGLININLNSSSLKYGWTLLDIVVVFIKIIDAKLFDPQRVLVVVMDPKC